MAGELLACGGVEGAGGGGGGVQSDDADWVTREAGEAGDCAEAPEGAEFEEGGGVEDEGEEGVRGVGAGFGAGDEGAQEGGGARGRVGGGEVGREGGGAAGGEVGEDCAELVEGVGFRGGEVVDRPVGAVHVWPAEVGEREVFFEGGAGDDFGPCREEGPDVAGHDGEVAQSHASGAKSYGWAEDGAEVGDAEVQLLDDGVHSCEDGDVGVARCADGGYGAAARRAVDEFDDR